MREVNVLIAEDDRDHQELLRLALTRSEPPLGLRFVGSGDELVQTIRGSAARPFDCIVLDFNLPDGQAHEVLRRLKDEGSGCPVIVISSSRTQEVVVESLRGGSVDFVAKERAFEGDQLRQRIDLAVRRWHRARRQRRQRQRRTEELTRRAETDALTGLYNRSVIDRLFEAHRAIPDRRGQAVVILLDLDHFKEINDTHGHAYGDRILCIVADTLRSLVEEQDTVCRWGGEEFLVIRPATTLAAGVLWTEKLRGAIEQAAGEEHEGAGGVTASLGLVACASRSLNLDAIARADEAMYLAKRSGRNRVCTAEMVNFERLVAEAEAGDPGLPERRLSEVLRLGRPFLGPTQMNHLGKHAEFVSKMSVRLGRALGRNGPELARLRLAGLCHDLGKFVIPEEVLAKTGALCCEEREFLSYHARYGAEMGGRLGLDSETSDFIRYHHVRFEDRILRYDSAVRIVPRGARILAVADAFLSMTSERSYQPARSFTAAVGELYRCQETQFDPEVVEALPRSLLAEVPRALGGEGCVTRRPIPTSLLNEFCGFEPRRSESAIGGSRQADAFSAGLIVEEAMHQPVVIL